MITTKRRHRRNVTDGYIEWRDTHLGKVPRGTHAATPTAPTSRGRRVMPSQQAKHRTPQPSQIALLRSRHTLSEAIQQDYLHTPLGRRTSPVTSPQTRDKEEAALKRIIDRELIG